MKFLLTITLLLAAFSFIQAQDRASPDRISTDDGDLIVQPITHGTIVLTWNEHTIYIDPYGGAKRFAGLENPNIILITDIHGDHLHLKTLEAINIVDAKLFVPQAVMEKLPEEMKAKATVVNNGENLNYKDISIAAIPMYNLPDDETSRHKKGRGNGYLLTMGEKRIYISGDTEDIPEMRSLKNIDVAFVCMNLPYTMDIRQAAGVVNEFKPAIVYPYHYRGSDGLSDVEGFMLLVNKQNPKIDVRLKNWYPEQ